MNDEMQTRFNCVIGKHYPAPIVEHKAAVKEARARISAARQTPGFRDEAKIIYAKLGSRKRQARRRPAAKKSRANQSSSTSSIQQLSFFMDDG